MLTIRYQFSYDTVIELIVMQELGKNTFLHLCIPHKWRGQLNPRAENFRPKRNAASVTAAKIKDIAENEERDE